MAETLVVFILLLLIFISNDSTVYSRSIIETLPGFRGCLPFKLETGYNGIKENEIEEKDDVQLLYYFVESERKPKDDPVVIWLAGGPSCSSFRAFFYEIGPFSFDYDSSRGKKVPVLELNPYSWTKVANVIFLDTPVGAGFSYGKTSEAYKTSDTLSSKHVYNLLRKWLKDHPKFISNPLYIVGVSYSGILVPIITQEIYNGNEAGNVPQMNIKGYMIGNPLTDRQTDFNSRIPYANRFALLSDELYESTKQNYLGDYINVNPNDGLCANDLDEVDEVHDQNFASYNSFNFSLKMSGTAAGFRRSDGIFPKKIIPINPIRLPPRLHQPRWRGETYDLYSIWANDEAVQRTLHVREGTIKEWEACNTDHFLVGKNDTATYSYDVASSVAYHRNLTNKSGRALIFSGDHDMVIPYLGTEKWIKSLNLTVESNWAPWFVEDEVAGYGMMFSHNKYSLTFATVKGAGHAAPEYKPEECLAMVDRWLGHYRL